MGQQPAMADVSSVLTPPIPQQDITSKMLTPEQRENVSRVLQPEPAPYGVMQAMERDEIAKTTPIQVSKFVETPEQIAARAEGARIAALERGYGGEVSYSQFLDGIENGIIKRVAVDGNGHTAYYSTSEIGVRGSTELINNPDFTNMLEKFKVELAVRDPPMNF